MEDLWGYIQYNPVCLIMITIWRKKGGILLADWNAAAEIVVFLFSSTLWASVTPAVNMFAIKWWCPVMMLIMMRLRGDDDKKGLLRTVYYWQNLRAASVDAAFAIFC